ncbi:GNAT family N-acetyltransferase [Phyllobacterium myrsinacearum]|uniref:RimJ/RimL family protein N-acetyltransferase n=1 Tax=Phyllobacterium myrsinacearum TaxID=28101 RepID=A0A839EIU6_9HYPH|nr:GNAT family N-acetyltransferase [Phyllobacterium myrsinacearum]MBA8878175.1 RimJ/RimL family protein N-acetyltransferase [Phyllobacterium myrsinacearum]
MLPTFETERLFLRPRTMADLEDCMTMDRDPEVTRYVPGPWHDPDAHRRFITARMEADFAPGLGYWSIFAKRQPELFLGWVLLIPDDAVGPDIEIGWRLNRHAWGKGYATEAARALVVHAFEHVGVERIIAAIHPDNTASMHVAEKMGLRAALDGFPYRYFSLSREDFVTAGNADRTAL